MLRSLRDLVGYPVLGTDGRLGTTHDFFFDDVRWNVRHIAVRIGRWPTERYVLLSPEVVLPLDGAAGRLPVGLSMEQIRLSPEMECDLPVACQKQVELSKYYTRAFAWSSLVPLGMPGACLAHPGFDESEDGGEPAGDPHLRSVREVMGYRLEGTDGLIGRVSDFAVHVPTWRIHRLLADVGGRLFRRRVEIPPDRIRSIQWASRYVRVGLSRQQIQDLPE